MAFLDINPVTPGHTLVILRVHHPNLNSLDEKTGMHLFKTTMRLASAIRKSGIRCEGINLFLADGETAGQEVFHAHMHIIPLFEGDKFKISVDRGLPPTRDELDWIAESFRKSQIP